MDDGRLVACHTGHLDEMHRWGFVTVHLTRNLLEVSPNQPRAQRQATSQRLQSQIVGHDNERNTDISAFGLEDASMNELAGLTWSKAPCKAFVDFWRSCDADEALLGREAPAT